MPATNARGTDIDSEPTVPSLAASPKQSLRRNGAHLARGLDEDANSAAAPASVRQPPLQVGREDGAESEAMSVLDTSLRPFRPRNVPGRESCLRQRKPGQGDPQNAPYVHRPILHSSSSFAKLCCICRYCALIQSLHLHYAR